MTKLDRIDVLDTAVLQIRFIKKNGGYHRTVLLPGESLISQIEAVNKHLILMEESPIDSIEIEKIAKVVSKEHTIEIIAKYKEKFK